MGNTTNKERLSFWSIIKWILVNIVLVIVPPGLVILGRYIIDLPVDLLSITPDYSLVIYSVVIGIGVFCLENSDNLKDSDGNKDFLVVAVISVLVVTVICMVAYSFLVVPSHIATAKILKSVLIILTFGLLYCGGMGLFAFSKVTKGTSKEKKSKKKKRGK